MDPSRYQRSKELLLGALDQPTAVRQTWLEHQCGEDQELLAEVEQLLSYETDGRELEGIPERVGPYRILRLIGEGGMGRVFEAEQESPRRRVALKVLLSSWANAEMRRRFELEAELLGRLEHPGIARIYEAGVTPPPDSTPYLSMELVDGRELSDWRTAELPSLERRTEVLIQLAEAVEQAHRQGIIHRDLKPSNVLVDAHDQPKVLDFGIARVLDSEDGRTMLTRSGQVLGTLAYMSPEQIEGGAPETLGDVYSLGVIAYELFGGELPYDLSATNLAEVSRVVQEGARKPLRQLGKELRGDIETVVHKALEVDRTRRYRSAQAFADDLRRILERQPIQARPASTTYQLRRFIARNRLVVGAGSVAAAALVIGATLALWRASEERKARIAAESARTVAEDARITADSEREGRALINDFLGEILRSTDPFDLGGDASLRDLLAKASRDAPRRFGDRPAIAAQVHTMLATSFRSIDDLRSTAEQSGLAVDLYRASYVEGDRESTVALANALALHSDSLSQLGQRDAALSNGEHAIELLDGTDDLASRAMARYSLARVLGQNGREEDSERLMRKASELAEGAPDLTIEARVNLRLGMAEFYRAAGDFDRAYDAFSEALAIQPDETPSDRYMRAQLLGDMLYCNTRAQREEIPDSYVDEHLRLWREMIDGDHSLIAVALSNHATLLRMMGRHAEAVEPYREALTMSERLFESPNDTIAINRGNLGALLMYLGRTEEARPLLEVAIEEQSALFGPRSRGVALNHGHLGDCFADAGDYVSARDQHRLSLEKLTESIGPSNYETVHQGLKTIEFELRTGEVDAARSRLDEALRRVPELPVSSQRVSLRRLEISLREASDASPDFALDACKRGVQLSKDIAGPPARRAELLGYFGALLSDLGALSDSKNLLEEALDSAEGENRDRIRADLDEVRRAIEESK